MKLLRSRFEKKKIVEKALYSFVNISIDYRDLQLIFCHEKKIFNSNEMEKITLSISHHQFSKKAMDKLLQIDFT